MVAHFDAAGVTETLVAAMPLLVLPVPVTRTHEPFVTADGSAVPVCWYFVDDVTMTFESPAKPWMSSVDPLRLTSLPLANGALPAVVCAGAAA
jgi:hypothetical protein